MQNQHPRINKFQGNNDSETDTNQSYATVGFVQRDKFLENMEKNHLVHLILKEAKRYSP